MKDARVQVENLFSLLVLNFQLTFQQLYNNLKKNLSFERNCYATFPVNNALHLLYTQTVTGY